MNRDGLRLWLACGIVAILAVVLVSPARAMIIGGGTSTGNYSAPSDDPGWSNVGVLAYSRQSAVYLSDGWVLMAGHAGSEPWVEFGGSSTHYDLSSWTNIGGADLQVAKLASIPAGVRDMDIASTAPSDGTFVVGIGYGYHRTSVTKKTWWVNTSTNPYTWYDTFHAGLPTAQGFNYGSAGTESWGYNRLNSSAMPSSHYDEGNGDTQLLYTVFNQPDPIGDPEVGNNIMQTAPGDSGGGLFVKNGDDWQLAGTLVYAYGYSGQPSLTAVYGNVGGAVNLSYYRNEILATIIPEPSSIVMLLGLGAAWLVCVWRRGHRAVSS